MERLGGSTVLCPEDTYKTESMQHLPWRPRFSALIGLCLTSKVAVEMPNLCQGFRVACLGVQGVWGLGLPTGEVSVCDLQFSCSVLCPFPLCPLTYVNHIESGEAPTMGKRWRSEFYFRIGLKHTNALSVCQLKEAECESSGWVLFE